MFPEWQLFAIKIVFLHEVSFNIQKKDGKQNNIRILYVRRILKNALKMHKFLSEFHSFFLGENLLWIVLIACHNTPIQTMLNFLFFFIAFFCTQMPFQTRKRIQRDCTSNKTKSNWNNTKSNLQPREKFYNKTPLCKHGFYLLWMHKNCLYRKTSISSS